jgi:outer membrane lipoprotein-sorting protein
MKSFNRFVWFIILGIVWPFALYAQQEKVPTAHELIAAMDANLSAKTSIVTSRMVVHGRRGSRTITSKSWVEGTDKAFTEYLAPPREAGTKMLKLGDQLWTYSPQTDRVIQISGHMLRQSLMGSDLSYQDMMEDQTLEDVYNGVVEGSEELNGRDSWIMTLTAKVDGLAYYKRQAWIDKEWLLPMREELYAKSGKLLKSSYAEEVMQVEGRWYPKVWIFKDELKRDSKGTEWIIDEITFNQTIPAARFEKVALRR